MHHNRPAGRVYPPGLPTSLTLGPQPRRPAGTGGPSRTLQPVLAPQAWGLGLSPGPRLVAKIAPADSAASPTAPDLRIPRDSRWQKRRTWPRSGATAGPRDSEPTRRSWPSGGRMPGPAHVSAGGEPVGGRKGSFYYGPPSGDPLLFLPPPTLKAALPPRHLPAQGLRPSPAPSDAARAREAGNPRRRAPPLWGPPKRGVHHYPKYR